MATQSFDKTFLVTKKKTIRRFKAKLKQKNEILVKKIDINNESKRGAILLKKSLSI
ncbi:hypothetical protein BegalDRAFT_2954 [Beggiatoa alba B18LD]|uniref:Uncharacterized protein n=1 Tax=Beggiatoa alba B18LD TaxID=395493 RepID=I3CJI9_9GAMM|nr:hypothetical protein [Beggiatoa alba]EIJ43782.1 hypothetical protein BegalDRAFT_2954 [Beggiatoa alba B18LD]